MQFKYFIEEQPQDLVLTDTQPPATAHCCFNLNVPGSYGPCASAGLISVAMLYLSMKVDFSCDLNCLVNVRKEDGH